MFLLNCIPCINWKKTGIFAAGVLFGTAGISLLASKDAKKAYTKVTAAVLRAKEHVVKKATILQENSCSRLSGTADIVLILYTLNNFLDGGEYVGTLEANIDTIQKAGSQVFLLNYPLASGSSFEDKISQANNYISSTAKALNVELIDLQSYFSSLQDHDPEEIFSGDGVHLTEEGYILMGDYIADVLHEYYFEMD